MPRQTTPQLSLFPFLSVLLSAAGVMVVVFAGTVLTALEKTSQRWLVTVRAPPQRKIGQEFDREPIYVICDDKGLLIFRSPAPGDSERIDAAKLTGDEVENVLRHAVDDFERRKDQQWPVLFVKQSGLKYRNLLYAQIKARNLKVGEFAFGEDAEIFCETTGGMIQASETLSTSAAAAKNGGTKP